MMEPQLFKSMLVCEKGIRTEQNPSDAVTVFPCVSLEKKHYFFKIKSGLCSLFPTDNPGSLSLSLVPAQFGFNMRNNGSELVLKDLPLRAA